MTGSIIKILEYGTLEENGDTLFLIRAGRMTLVDASFAVDQHLMRKTVSAIGRFGIPRSAPGITKLLVEKLVSHDQIAHRAFAIHESGQGGSAEENWFRAERELLED